MGWLAGWTKRVKMTIDSGDILVALANFPVLVYLSSASGRGPDDVTFVFDEVGANSLKIAVTEDDGTTECKVEIEKWDSVGEEAWLWVKVPAIASAVDTDLYLYFDNAHADNNANVGVVGSAPGQAVWDANFICVFHFSEAAGNFLDSTSNNYDASAQGTIVRGSEKINDGIDVLGSNDYARIDTVGIENNHDELTVEAWAKGDAFTTDRAVVGDWAGSHDEVFLLYYESGGDNSWRILFEDDDGAVKDEYFGASPPAIGTWYHIAGTYKKNDFVYGYQNGVQTVGDATANVRLESTTAKIAIGEEFAGDGKDFNGHIDEVRLSDIARTESWMNATYESGDDDLIDFGTEEVPVVIERFQEEGTDFREEKFGAIWIG